MPYAGSTLAGSHPRGQPLAFASFSLPGGGAFVNILITNL